MIWTIASFELRKRRGLLSTYIYFALFLAFGALWVLSAGGAFANVSAGAGSERVHANAPSSISALIGAISDMGVLVSAAVFGQAVHQDFESGVSHLFFTLPLKKSSYLTGRFLGALLFVLLVFSGAGVGALLASVSPVLVERSYFGPFRLATFVWPYVTHVLPNALLTGGVFFALATLTRRMMPVYAGAVILAVGYLLAQILLADVENRDLAALLDPFGESAARAATRYWTTSEKNRLLIPLTGVLLANRALWLAVGLGALGLTYARFSFSAELTPDRAARRDDASPPPPLTRGPVATAATRPGNALVLLRMTRLGLVETLKSPYLAVFALAGGIFTLTVAHITTRLEGTPIWPVTHTIAEVGEGGFVLFILIIITFYAGEIAWRERDLRFDQITDALPIPTWVPYLSKLIALCLTPAVLLAAVMAFGVGYQTFNGYYHYEIGLYLEWLYGVALPGYVYMAILAFTVQSVVQNKYIGHFAMVAFYLLRIFQAKLGLEHGLFQFANVPHPTYSDMNGFGHFIKPMTFYSVYWGGVALVLAVVGDLFWTRGTETSWRTRLSIARGRLTRGPVAVGALGLLVAAGMGGAIYYESDVLEHYETSHETEAVRADYEKKYKSLEETPQPRITDVNVEFDIYPESETLETRGTYRLENKSTEPISRVYVRLLGDKAPRRLVVGGVDHAAMSDERMGTYAFDLPTPLLPGASVPLEWDIQFHDEGFKDEGNRTDICANGTFFNSFNLPHIGYNRQAELALKNDRKKYGLAPRDPFREPNDPKGLANNLLDTDADWVTFESTVSTSPDQIAIVPGYLDKEWTSGGRRYFHYKMDSKILDFYSVVSGRYRVLRDKWVNPLGAEGAPSPEVNLEIYYHPGHEFDLDEMMRGLKDSLTYDTAAFGPYQHRQARIIEFPRYQSFAQSYPNTIPWSEGVGFILRVDLTKDDEIDFPYFIAAHELGHQWWAHQVIGGQVQGVTLLDETLAQYSALMVLKKRFGAGQMRRFLKYEMDQYLRGRATEARKELPLERVENQQYIHYNKGSVVMYALQDYIGEENVNRALHAFVSDYKFRGPPYPNALALVDELRKVTPAEMQYVLHDMFETITLYDDRALAASAAKLPDGKYEITLKLSAKKLRAEGEGEETEVPMDDLVDVGALDEKNRPIALERRRVKSGESEVKLVVDRLPAKAGIDPIDKLIDRHPDDNVVAVAPP